MPPSRWAAPDLGVALFLSPMPISTGTFFVTVHWG